MTQINIRLDPDTDEIINYRANRRNVAKTVMVRELLAENLSQNLLSILLGDYKSGKIGFKKIIKLSKLSPFEVMEKIAILGMEPPLVDVLDDYTQEITDRLIEGMKPQIDP